MLHLFLLLHLFYLEKLGSDVIEVVVGCGLPIELADVREPSRIPVSPIFSNRRVSAP